VHLGHVNLLRFCLYLVHLMCRFPFQLLLLVLLMPFWNSVTDSDRTRYLLPPDFFMLAVDIFVALFLWNVDVTRQNCRNVDGTRQNCTSQVGIEPNWWRHDIEKISRLQNYVTWTPKHVDSEHVATAMNVCNMVDETMLFCSLVLLSIFAQHTVVRLGKGNYLVVFSLFA